MKQLVFGNEAVALGALRAGMTFFAAYPITPASEIMHVLAEREKEIVFLHAEDEIASIHMAIGGSLAGRKAMTSTSGPGFSLKQEGIGLAHMMEVPLVVVDVQRVGPSTGMPTLPSQGDILQAAHGSHGDYTALVFYPASVAECYRYTIEAFNAAEESRSPVVLLLDGFLAHLSETVDLDAISVAPKPRTLAPLGQGQRHFTGLLAKDGTPRTKSPGYYREWHARVKAKVLAAAGNYRFSEFVRNERADTLLIAYGIAARVIRPLRSEYSLFRPVTIFPILEDELRAAAAGHKRVVVVEMNDGQYRGEVQKVLLREVLGVPELGGAISLNEIRERLHDL
jgi:2-oxoglutarate/2-oxoacid ferredoxin oxidoreductase subunit alpha